MNTKEMYKLRSVRDRLDLSQKEAAKRLGINVDVLSNYERGKTYPNVLILRKIEEVYGIKYDRLIFLEKNNAIKRTLRRNKNERSTII